MKDMVEKIWERDGLAKIKLKCDCGKGWVGIVKKDAVLSCSCGQHYTAAWSGMVVLRYHPSRAELSSAQLIRIGEPIAQDGTDPDEQLSFGGLLKQ